MLRLFGREDAAPATAKEDAGIAALRLIVLELASDAARRAPSPEGYLDSRRAAVLTALDGGVLVRLAAWRRHRRLTREIEGFFAAAKQRV